MNKKGLLIVISGPSGAGKGTICKAILEKHPEIQLSVSVTTRPLREGEVDGVNYFFKSEGEFLAMVENGEFLEYAKVFDAYYGTPKKYVKDMLLAGQDVILEIDIQGALKVKDKFEEGVFIFIVPPSMDELKRRIVSRGTESQEAIVNDTIEEATRKIEAIIIAEKCRVDRNREMNIILQGGEIK
jgi:guanylate kinase